MFENMNHAATTLIFLWLPTLILMEIDRRYQNYSAELSLRLLLFPQVAFIPYRTPRTVVMRIVDKQFSAAMAQLRKMRSANTNSVQSPSIQK